MVYVTLDTTRWKFERVIECITACHYKGKLHLINSAILQHLANSGQQTNNRPQDSPGNIRGYQLEDKQNISYDY